MKRIKGFEQYIITRRGDVYRKLKKLKPDTNSAGYLRVSLSKNGKVTRRFIHQLVAEHYVENPYNLPVVNHKDRDRKNNADSNLEWMTTKQNVDHGWKAGRRNPNRFDDDFEKEVYDMVIKTTMLQKEIAQYFGIHRDTVREITKRLRGRSNDYRKARAKLLNRVE
ncbi:hypothetical protein [Escherichia phage UPEC06]|nr:hypothetical protein [Escherichia phage UPEC06]